MTSMVLQKKISSPSAIPIWKSSSAYHDIIEFVESVAKRVKGKAITGNYSTSENITCILNFLQEFRMKIEHFPPEEQSQRFGNKAFRTWCNWMATNVRDTCKNILVRCIGNLPTDSTISFEEAVAELSEYLVDSFGNATRLDYGTGHELAFIAFLCCLCKLGVIRKPTQTSETSLDDYASCALVIMPAYLALVRNLQTVYRLEPAGSHGVWCLDDFQFVPFIWGSSQLIGHTTLRPSSITDRHVAASEKDAYLLFSCIDYIHKVKSGPFAEHSPTLCGISEVPHWEKVHSGLIKMYKGEVLDKFPVVQHFRFGRMLTMDRASETSQASFGPGHMPPPLTRPVPSRLPESSGPNGPSGEQC